ncbi:hypothetical protein AVHY2522_12960 [Acidovorax sp. SUPP2522]|uniref:hypothetical protein n=1 Tax=unclassified Acidovorax TaxID=2684926 RepID=UPI00234A23F9|nr:MULTISPECIES: hypothetical protein [unclassified Acidovorax]WCM98320.1 hypothetical protein M5C96_02295 [Acidovorax sp. GBBC 1281]GKT16789.1 hypothetical protein AVHY2522_12960 [Acidovorax sp. SUPP2522]
MENLEIIAQKTEYHYDENDTNAVNFITQNGYLSLQICVYIDPGDDPPLTEPHIELDSQKGGHYGGVDIVEFHPDKIIIYFKKKFLKKYDQVVISIPWGVDKEMVSFFVNHLFMGDKVAYSSKIDKNLHTEQTEFQEDLDGEDD